MVAKPPGLWAFGLCRANGDHFDGVFQVFVQENRVLRRHEGRFGEEVLQVGLVVRDQMGVVHAAREAARAASVASEATSFGELIPCWN